MNFDLMFASDEDRIESFTATTLQDLQDLQEKFNHKLVIDFNRMTIVVYDDYME